MACVALSSLKSTIQLEFLQPFPRVPLLHHQEPIIHSFLRMISSLQAFLKESRGAAAIKDLEIEIRDFALKAEDNIEIQLRNFVLAKDKEDQEKASQQLHQALQEAAENASELLSIIDKVSNEADDDEENEIQQPSIHHWLKHAYSEFGNDKFDVSSQCFPELVGGKMVGRHRDREEIINNLIPKSFSNFFISSSYFSPSFNNKINLVFIVGMMGIGKTTLAKSVYGDSLVEDYFDVRGWITMPQEYNKTQIIRLLLRSILPAVENKFGKGSAIQADKLAEQVRTQLRAKKFLIVLDNIHDSRALHDIQMCVYCCDPGSTILLTTGNFNLRFDPIFYHHQYTHYMTLLDQNQSWDLFCNNMVFLKGRVALEFEKIKSHIVEICDGLPWSIVAVAERLAKCHDILKEWEKVKKEMESLGILDHKALTFHYNQLSEHLKVCFLYFGVFPKRKEIQVKKLAIMCWLSLYAHSFDYYVLFSTNKPRSIFFFDDDPKTFVPFTLLRVLAFVPASFLQRVSIHAGHLIFLRYLFISQRFEGLGNIVSNNPNLHTLIVSSDEPQIGAPTIHLPSTIWELPHLRHLELGDTYTMDLRTLSLVSPTHCGREVHFDFPKIRKLELFYKEDLVPSHIGSSSSNPITLYNLDYLEWLERLTISISIGCIVTLPERFMFPSQLKKLNLSGAKLSQRDLTAIGMLPELRVLKLENALLERVWEVARGEFRKLRFLLIEDKKLKQLQIDETYTLLRFEHLVLRCYCLEQIPLRFVGPDLKHIELDGCNPSIVASAKQLISNHLFGLVELIIDRAVFYGLSSFRR